MLNRPFARWHWGTIQLPECFASIFYLLELGYWQSIVGMDGRSECVRNVELKTKPQLNTRIKHPTKPFTMLIPFQYRYVCVSWVTTAVQVREIPSEIFNDGLTTPTYHHRGIMEEYY